MSGSRNKRKRKEAAQSTPLKADKRPPRSPAVSVPAEPAPSDAAMRTGFRKEMILIVLFIVVATAAAYSNLYRNEFLIFDDNEYVTENNHVKSGLSLDEIRWAFSFEDKRGGYWQPFTWLIFMAAYQIFGLNSAAFHITNLLIHVFNSLLLFFLLKRLTGRLYPSGFVAMLFALHPLNVESVAWAAEIKTTASTFFGLLTIYLYTGYVREKSVKRYAACLVCFCASFMFKPHLATLPFVLLLLDWWPLDRIDLSKITRETLSGIKALILEKVPFFILSAASVIIGAVSLTHSSVVEQGPLPDLAYRLENALVSYAAYIFKLVLPIRLAAYYPNPASYELWKPVCAAVLLLALSLAVIKGARKRPWVAVGWFWYLGVLFPMLGFVRSGLWPEMADRFTYVPAIGLFIIAAWGCAEIGTRMRIPEQNRRSPKRVLLILPALALAGFSVVTWIQVGYWHNNLTLYNHGLNIVGPVDFLFDGRGVAYALLGDQSRAIGDFDRAIGINPKYHQAYNNRGNAHAKLGDQKRALEDYSKAIVADPSFALAYLNRGITYGKLGDQKRALEDYGKAIVADPSFAPAYLNRGIAYGELGDQKQALQDFNKAIEIHPRYAEAYNNRGVVYGKLGDLTRAIEDYGKAIGINPINADAYYNRANAYTALGRYMEAISDLTKAIQIDSKRAEFHNNRGNVYGKLNDLKQAIDDYSHAIEINPQSAEAYNNRGAAYFRLGNPRQAVEDYNWAIGINPGYAKAYNNRAAAYANLGNPKDAIADYDKAIQINPESPEIFINRGIAYSMLDQTGPAIKDFDRALEISPGNVRAYDNRGMAYTRLGDYRRAIQDYDMAINTDPRFADAYYNRGVCYDKLGNRGQAVENLKKAAGLNHELAQNLLKSYGIKW
jgi:tetratricopeptide (TPR) repeat protein